MTKHRWLIPICAAIAWTLLAAPWAVAQETFFVPPGGVGNWNVPGSWTSGHVPVDPEVAFVHAGRVANVDSVVTDAARYLYLANFDQTDADIDGTLNILPGADFTVGEQMHVGEGAGPVHGVLNQTGGNLTVNGALFLAFGSSDTAEYNLSAGTVSIRDNLWFRFGNGLLMQTGGTLTAGQLVLGEGGDGTGASLYTLKGGSLNILGDANIGKAPGGGDPLANSHGSMTISGGVATFGGLLFGNDATDVLRIQGAGVLNVDQQFYSEFDAQADITAGRILGASLSVSTIDIDGLPFTKIVSTAPFPTGDYNHDGVVDTADYTIWRDTLGATGTGLAADGDSNNVVNNDDLLIWKNNFGVGQGGGGLSVSTSVPEPGTILLGLIGLAFFGWISQRRVPAMARVRLN